MLRFLAGLFIILHGLVHVWYIVLSQRWVEFQPDMGWTGRSWLLSNFLSDSTLRPLAGVLYAIAALAFVICGVGVMFQWEELRPILIGAAIFSSVVILLFWDGGFKLLIQKGILGLLINLVILVLLIFR